MTDAATFAINYAYDDNGNPGQVLNRNGGPFNSVYYGDNRLFTSQTPLGKTTTFTYIKRGMPATVVKPSQQGTSLNTTFSYDDRGRLTGKVDPVGSSVYTPDPDNNVLTHTENGKTITRVYGDVNRLTSYTDEGGNVIGYQYDNNGNLLKLTYPGNKAVNYVYDSNNRLTTVTDWASRVTSITYDLAGRVLSITRPNNTVRNIGYDNAGETTQIQELMPSANGLVPIAYYKLVYDEAGRMTNEFIAPLPTAYSEPAETVVPDADNRILTFNGLTVVHDADGNMTSGPLNGNSLVTHVYDARNRLTAVGASGTAPALSYGYDSEGNRTSVTQGTQTTRYVVNPAGSQVLIRTRADGTQTFYVYGLGLLYDVEMTSAGVETGVQHTYHYDLRGSTIAVTSAAGAVTDRVQYSVYGRITLRTGSTDTPFLYNGRYGVQTDANGLYYMRARYYNPYICRFINADPAGFGGGMNWYAFADGNPISLTDPFGLGAVGDNVQGNSFINSKPVMDLVGMVTETIGLVPTHDIDPSQPLPTSGLGKYILDAQSNLTLDEKLMLMGMSASRSPSVSRSGPPIVAIPGLTPNEISAQLELPFTFPRSAGDKTSGILIVEGNETPIVSGVSGPAQNIPSGTAGFDIVTRTHVEGHAAALMLQNNVSEATLYLNNLPCSSCSRNLPNALPAGSALRIVAPDGTVVIFKGGG